MEYLSAIVTVAIIHLLAVMSPGPDFVMLTRNSLIYSRKTGVFTALGLGIGIILHVIYSIVGIGVLISQSIVLFNILKFLGAAYLIYLGYKSLTSKATSLDIKDTQIREDISRLKAVKIGFLTNALNPKVTLFFLSVFTMVINPKTPLGVKIFMGLEMSVVTFLWFAFLAYVVSHRFVKLKISKVQHFAEKFIGVVLISLGIKVALSSSK